MFVCESCIKNYYVRFPELALMLKSYGSCEDCQKTKMCFDLPHDSYAHINSNFANEKSQQELEKLGYKRIKETKE